MTTSTWKTAPLPSSGRLARLSQSLILGLIVVLAAAAAESSSPVPGFAGAAIALTYMSFYVLNSWRALGGLLFCVIWFIPIKRYQLPAHLPFDLEPYRILVAFLMLVWVSGLLLDRRIRTRGGGGLETPMIVFYLACLASICINFRHIELEGYEVGVLKGLSFFTSFVLVYFLLTSVTRTRADLDFFIKVLVAGAGVVAGSSIIEYRTGYNVFNHLTQVFPVLQFTGPLTDIGRSDRLRVYASAQHPIALAAALEMMIPLAIYLGKSTRQVRWWWVAFLLGLGVFATISRTGITMLIASLVMFWIYRPKDTKRLLPLLIPAVCCVFLVLPSALGSVESAFFPQHGLIADQQGTGQVGVGHKDGRLATLGPGLRQWEKHPFFGTGFGARIIDPTDPLATNSNILDDQWLGQLLDTGAIGVGALLWLLIRSTRRLGRLARRDHGNDGFLACALATASVSFAVGALTFDAFSFIQVTFLFFIVLALGASLLGLRKDRPHVLPSATA